MALSRRRRCDPTLERGVETSQCSGTARLVHLILAQSTNHNACPSTSPGTEGDSSRLPAISQVMELRSEDTSLQEGKSKGARRIRDEYSDLVTGFARQTLGQLAEPTTGK